ncbi:hypothetical protein A3F08_00505 [Candidatus Berkelbacteria bacterium RIFCSPHIGHO2_12_FULL_36_9]|uniref:Nucleotidyl transferase AbiEii/AbiGii toxin family protein n=1 Tax=Candidatus Berkelbacteria bacterium RIFCSPHIGHO2_12_FULL_36_9 TaxID=1797469 RepID=A0A1F5EFA9_9BACT|nr:MAG: hypothetical protein A3F08_00505 [Candidatus Berkelbacteria bacterium RIFCSPHIGHO2_12_FULL_36_9]
MAKEILSKTQKQFIDFFKNQKKLANIFYLTGGTALANYYLHHRYSDDLDFFTHKENLDGKIALELMEKVKDILDASELTYNKLFDRRIFYLKFTNRDELKVEFTYYPFKQLENPKLINNILVDGFYDLSVNKLFSIIDRSEIKDYVDLYYILKKISLEKLRKGVKKKFGAKIEVITLGAKLIEVENFTILPRMIKKLTLSKLKTFFLKEGNKLKPKILI